ncbi:MAG: GTP 3',8-cyclase MoaA [Pirellulaceae bacterium]
MIVKTLRNEPPDVESANGPSRLVDTFGRVHDSLRISVIDRCNIRCFYCMPEQASDFFPKEQLLTFDEITRAVRLFAEVGIRKIRLTGGEPLLRPDLHLLVAAISEIDRIEEIALTSNGILLPRFAHDLKNAGLNRLNISLDTLNEETFQRVTRRAGVHRVIAGIDHAINIGFDEIRLNALAIRGLTEAEVIPLVEFARRRNLTIRFIEFMPLDGDKSWRDQNVLTGAEVLKIVEERFGTLHPTSRPDASQPSIDYSFDDGSGHVGFINPVSQPFCNTCNRLRLTADGGLRNCLFSDENWDLGHMLRSQASDREIMQTMRASVLAKQAGHLISHLGFQQPAKAMYQIGG